jgi:transaldolase
MVDKKIGFSLWLDFVERDYLQSEFRPLIDRGVVNGATSNPSIFASAISSSLAYKEQLSSLHNKTPKERYEAMAIADIKLASQKLRDCYDNGNDGYISIEVDPFLSDDTKGTIDEAKRLFSAISEPNIMIKIPATDAGYEAIYALLSIGISVNATLIFSPTQAQKCIDAMSRGLDELSTGVGLQARAVISVFVSRFDRLLDSSLIEKEIEPSRTGILNASKIYNIVEESKNPHIRTLFASTGVKGDKLKADYYIRELLAPHSINTAPLATIEEYIKSDATPPKLPIDQKEIEEYFKRLEDNGIDMDRVYTQLTNEGLLAFEKAFEEMLRDIG